MANEQDVDLTRDEYLALKQHLAKMRGLLPAAPAAAPTTTTTTTEPRRYSNPAAALEENTPHVMEHLDIVAQIAPRRNRGCTTPAENFIVTLLIMYAVNDERGTGLLPEEVKDKLDEFDEELEEAISASEFIASRYPKFAPEPAE